MESRASNYEIKLAFIIKRIEKLFSENEKIVENYEIPFPANNLKLGPLENETVQNLLDHFRFVMDRNEFSVRSWLLVEAVIRVNPGHYSAYDYRKSFINKIKSGTIEWEGRNNAANNRRLLWSAHQKRVPNAKRSHQARPKIFPGTKPLFIKPDRFHINQRFGNTGAF